MCIKNELFIEIEKLLSEQNLIPFEIKVIKQNKNVTFLHIYHMNNLYYLYKFHNSHYSTRITNHKLLSNNKVSIPKILIEKKDLLLLYIDSITTLSSYINQEALLNKTLELIISLHQITNHELRSREINFLHENSILFLKNRLKELSPVLELQEIFHSYKLHQTQHVLSVSNMSSFNILTNGHNIWINVLPSLTLQHPLYNITGILETVDIDPKLKKSIYNKFSTHFSTNDFDIALLVLSASHFLRHISYGHNLKYYWNKLINILHNRKLFKLHSWFIKHGVFE